MIWLLLSCTTGMDSAIPISKTIIVEPNDMHFPPIGACDDSNVPIVAIHGFLASSDTYESHSSRWAANGHCLDRFFGFDWNTFDQESALSELEDFVDLVLAETGSSQVDMLGHSAGGGLAHEYVVSLAQGKVRKYVHIGSFSDLTAPEIPMLNLWSSADYAVPGSEITGTENQELPGDDHYQVATSAQSFTAIYQFLYGVEPATLNIALEEQIELWGKALYFGENQVALQSLVEAYRLDPNTGMRLNDDPDYRFTTGQNGLWGPLPTSATDLWELTLLDDSGVPIRHYYAPFESSTNLLRLRGLPENGLAAALLSAIPLEDENTVNMVSFSKQQGVIAGRDSLIIDGVEFVTTERAPAEDTIIALFHFDNGSDGLESEDPVQFGNFPFIAGTDSVWLSNEEESIETQFNQQSRFIPKWGHGVVIAIY